ncbi:MAG: hypothetical protein HYZ10_15385 [Ignavibacteriales bacterium]|nr:hypothetical protein [Ignavibacteriales bacterium]
MNSAKALRTYLGKIKNSETLVFLDEAIKCLELDLYRSAVVLTWVGAISVLYDYVYKNKLSEFNNEGRRINPKWKDIQTIDDFSRIKESDFLDMIASISILGKNVKEFLKNNCLGLRNSCGHPNSFKIGKHTVEAHIEHLILNVFSKF